MKLVLSQSAQINISARTHKYEPVPIRRLEELEIDGLSNRRGISNSSFKPGFH